MRKVVILLLFCLAASSRIPAQQAHYLVGPQLDINYLTGLGTRGGSFGGRFHYNSQRFSLEALRPVLQFGAL